MGPRAIGAVGRRFSRVVSRDPGGHLVADESLERPLHQLGPRQPDAREEGLVHLHDAQSGVGHDHEVDERVERVFEEPALPEDLLEELDVLDGGGELAAQLVREIDELRAFELVGERALDDQRAERAAPAAQRGQQQHRAAVGHDLRPFQPHSTCGRRIGVLGGDAAGRRGVASVRRSREDQLTGATLMQPDRRAPRPEQGIGVSGEGLERGVEIQRRRHAPRERHGEVA